MKIKSIKTYARQAYKNRYGFASVSIGDNGVMLGHWDEPHLDPIKLGHIGDCSTAINARKTGLVFSNRGHVVYTFGMPA